jgi:hypothetical protein
MRVFVCVLMTCKSAQGFIDDESEQKHPTPPCTYLHFKFECQAWTESL